MNTCTNWMGAVRKIQTARFSVPDLPGTHSEIGTEVAAWRLSQDHQGCTNSPRIIQRRPCDGLLISACARPRFVRSTVSRRILAPAQPGAGLLTLIAGAAPASLPMPTGVGVSRLHPLAPRGNVPANPTVDGTPVHVTTEVADHHPLPLPTADGGVTCSAPRRTNTAPGLSAQGGMERATSGTADGRVQRARTSRVCRGGRKPGHKNYSDAELNQMVDIMETSSP